MLRVKVHPHALPLLPAVRKGLPCRRVSGKRLLQGGRLVHERGRHVAHRLRGVSGVKTERVFRKPFRQNPVLLFFEDRGQLLCRAKKIKAGQVAKFHPAIAVPPFHHFLIHVPLLSP